MPLRVVTVAGEPELETHLAEAIDAHADFHLLMRCVDRMELLGAVRGGSLDAIVCAGFPHWLDPQPVEEARSRGIWIVVAGDATQARDRIARLGLLTTPAEPDAIVDVLRTSTQPPPPPSPNSPAGGRLIAVWGPKGAPGRSSIALELAWQVARIERATLLMDGDPYGGDLLQLTGVVEELPTIVWAARMAAKGELDESLLVPELRRVGRHGPVLLPGLPRPDLWPEVSEFGWRRLLEVTRAMFGYVICDTGFCFEPDASPYPEAGEGRNRIARAALDEADQIVAVCRADPVGVKQFTWALDALRALVDLEKVVVVLNRARGGSARELGDVVRRHTGKKPAACIPDRGSDWRKAIEAGVPVSELKSDVCAAMKPIVARLGLDVPSRGFLSRLAGRS